MQSKILFLAHSRRLFHLYGASACRKPREQHRPKQFVTQQQVVSGETIKDKATFAWLRPRIAHNTQIRARASTFTPRRLMGL